MIAALLPPVTSASSAGRRLRVACAFIAALAAYAQAALAEEAIQSFQSEISIAREGTVRVVETIDLRAEGNQIRRGIYRDISTTFEDAQGKVRRVSFSLLGVTRDGRPESYHTERHGDFTRIYIGSEDVFLDTGPHTYALSYETDRQIRWFDGKPELFWNVTGNDWAFPILHVRAKVVLPDRVAPTAWDAYTGRIGERGHAYAGSVGDDGTLHLTSSAPLGPGEGLSFVVQIPPDAVLMPAAGDELRYALLDYREWIIAALGLIVVLCYYLWAWDKVGRDPRGGPIIPLFHPPEGISASLAAYIRNWGFGGDAWKSFTASALALAVRGLLTFDQEGKDLVLERTETPSEPLRSQLSAGELSVLNWVEGRGGRAEINKANGKSVAKAGTDFQRSVNAEGGKKYFRRNLAYVAGGVLLSVLTVLAILFFGLLTQEEIGFMIAVLFVGVFIGVFLGPIVGSLFSGRGASSLIGSVVMLFVLVGFGLNALGDLASDAFQGGSWLAVLASVKQNAFPFALMLIFPLLNGIFYYLLQAPTAAGRPVMDQIEGFRMYLQTAESGRLNIADAPEITAERFEALLPYAVALGVERPWADAFAAALKRAYPDDPDPMSHYHSRWRRGGNWSSSNFGRSIASSVANATSAASSSIPRSSSGSSGFSGGSGGGGGGRGGGGW